MVLKVYYILWVRSPLPASFRSNLKIPYLKIEKLDIVNKPEDEFVYPPDDTYIPTSVIY